MGSLIVIAGILLAALGTLPVFPAHSLLVDLFSHFVFQYLLAACLLLVLSLALRCWRSALVPLLAMAINGSWLLPYLPTAPAGENGPRLTVIQANLENSNPDHKTFVAWVRRRQPDLLVVEELSHTWLESLAALDELFPYRFLIPRSDRFGIGIYSRLPIIRRERRELAGFGLPTLFARIQ
ncbi:MAG: hypothetical protein QGF09_13070 [Rhodospirillales bacterium]|jgi:endonuclease/exonuclease/phosphatase (EEP) superfamily protein YafD|nr:hypothetical protein [Rhodospirillales bacterium]